jgi:hypothetical protein
MVIQVRVDWSQLSAIQLPVGRVSMLNPLTRAARRSDVCSTRCLAPWMARRTGSSSFSGGSMSPPTCKAMFVSQLVPARRNPHDAPPPQPEVTTPRCPDRDRRVDREVSKTTRSTPPGKCGQLQVEPNRVTAPTRTFENRPLRRTARSDKENLPVRQRVIHVIRGWHPNDGTDPASAEQTGEPQP